MKGGISVKRVPPLSVTLRHSALKDISSDNHDDKADCPIDIFSDMVYSSALVARSSGVWGSKLGVGYMPPICNHLDSLASGTGAAGVCCSDIIFPGGVSSVRSHFSVAEAHGGGAACGSILLSLQSWSSSLIQHTAGLSDHDVSLPRPPTK